VLDDEAGIACPRAREIGLVFQSYALWPHRTVFENVAYGLRLRKRPADEIKTRVEAILEKLGLAHLAARYPDQLSGGQQQRVAICRALVYEPKVLLLDEPLSNLDAKLREEARFWIRKLILDLGICAIMVTHDQSEALAIADHVLLLKGGSIVQDGTPIQIYGGPTNFYAADFMGTNNVLSGAYEAQADGSAIIRCDGWSLPGIWRDAEPPRDPADIRAVVGSRPWRSVPSRRDEPSAGCRGLHLSRRQMGVPPEARQRSAARAGPCGAVIRCGALHRAAGFDLAVQPVIGFSLSMSTGPRIALIHATPVAIDPSFRPSRRSGPRPSPSVSSTIPSRSTGRRRPTSRRPSTPAHVALADYAVSLGAKAILFTCSAFGPSIEAASRAGSAFRCSSPTRRCSRRPWAWRRHRHGRDLRPFHREHGRPSSPRTPARQARGKACHAADGRGHGGAARRRCRSP
jgi:ABC-type polar amino acid transport system ATPase subunit